MNDLAPKFGTSGLRGLVSELTPELIQRYTRAFLAACQTGTGVFVGADLRPSSPQIVAEVVAALRQAGVAVTECGAVPTPALALAAMAEGAAAIMVTGSHIPADRNGLKFFLPSGEISKADEAAIGKAFAADADPQGVPPGRHDQRGDVLQAYITRYTAAFGPQALAGLRLGIYQHSSVARDMLVDLATALGATPIALGRSETFVPVDTEAVDEATRGMLETWCKAHRLDAILSTDGDADRPMLTTASGQVIQGDILGVMTARALGATVIVTPISSNSMVSTLFDDVRLTRIGSPHVIAGIEAVLQGDPSAPVVGFEANGGFLLGFRAKGPLGGIAPLLTRDSVLPMVVPLAAARARGQSLEALIAELPPRIARAGRLQEIDPARAAAFLAALDGSEAAMAAFAQGLGPVVGVNRVDGTRMRLADGRILHLRPSGNAPEFRIYVEADSEPAASALLDEALSRVAAAIA